MYEVMAESTPDVLAIRVGGKLRKADYERLNPCSTPGWPHIMEDLHGWDGPAAMIEDLKLGVAHHADVRRVAMVGDRAWQEWLTRLAAPFMRAEVRYFGRGQGAQARAWVRERPAA